MLLPRLALGILLPLSAAFLFAGCRPTHYTPKVGVENTSGSSSDITPGGPSQTWFTGSHPPPGNIGAGLPALDALHTASGAAPLVWHDGLASVARRHSIDMRTQGYLGIISPDGYDVFQSLVAANPSISFDSAFVAVYQVTPFNTGINAVILADPIASAALRDPSYTHWGLVGDSDKVTFTWYTLILAKNAQP